MSESPCFKQYLHNLDALLCELQALGVAVDVAGDKLRIEAPAGSTTPELRQAFPDNNGTLLVRSGSPAGARRSQDATRRVTGMAAPAWTASGWRKSKRGQQTAATGALPDVERRDRG